jgi:hypothetical protein
MARKARSLMTVETVPLLDPLGSAGAPSTMCEAFGTGEPTGTVTR